MRINRIERGIATILSSGMKSSFNGQQRVIKNLSNKASQAGTDNVTPLTLIGYTYARYRPCSKAKDIENLFQKKAAWNNKSAGAKAESYLTEFGLPILTGVIAGLIVSSVVYYREDAEDKKRTMDGFNAEMIAVNEEYQSLIMEMKTFRLNIDIYCGMTSLKQQFSDTLKERKAALEKRNSVIAHREANYVKDHKEYLNRHVIDKADKSFRDTKESKEADVERAFTLTDSVITCYMGDSKQIEKASENVYKALEQTKSNLIAARNILDPRHKDLISMANIKKYEEDFYQAFAAYLIMCTENSEYNKANEQLYDIFNSKGSGRGKNKPLLSIEDAPDFLLCRISNYILRGNANDVLMQVNVDGENFTFDNNLKIIPFKKNMSAEDRYYLSHGLIESILKEAIEKNPRIASGYNLLASLYKRDSDLAKRQNNTTLQKEFHNKAMENIERAVFLSPNNPSYRVEKAILHNKMGHYDRAIEEINYVFVNLRDAENQSAHIAKANAHFNKREYTKAIKQLDRVAIVKDKKINDGTKLPATNNLITGARHEIIANVLEKSHKHTDKALANEHRIVAEAFDKETCLTAIAGSNPDLTTKRGLACYIL